MSSSLGRIVVASALFMVFQNLLAIMDVKDRLTQSKVFRCHFDDFVVLDILHGLLQGEWDNWSEANGFISTFEELLTMKRMATVGSSTANLFNASGNFYWRNVSPI